MARLRREAPGIALSERSDSEYEVADEVAEDELDAEPVNSSPMSILDDGSPQLIQLTRLPRIGFTTSLLRKRILQWRRMGLDVSEVEPALKSLDEEHAYSLYSLVEEKVRKAVELDRYITAHQGAFSASEEASARFRIRQLTGLEELSKKYFEN